MSSHSLSSITELMVVCHLLYVLFQAEGRGGLCLPETMATERHSGGEHHLREPLH